MDGMVVSTGATVVVTIGVEVVGVTTVVVVTATEVVVTAGRPVVVVATVVEDPPRMVVVGAALVVVVVVLGHKHKGRCNEIVRGCCSRRDSNVYKTRPQGPPNFPVSRCRGHPTISPPTPSCCDCIRSDNSWRIASGILRGDGRWGGVEEEEEVVVVISVGDVFHSRRSMT